MTEMIPQRIIDKMATCSQCAGHNEHTKCEVNYQPLQAWMERIEARLDAMESLAITPDEMRETGRPS